MKITDKKKQVKTIPKGVWESPHTDKSSRDENHVKNLATDLQNNGYSNIASDSRRASEGKKTK